MLKLGEVPSVYDTPMQTTATIQGRAVNRAPHQYSVVWYPGTDVNRKIIETDDYHLIPIRDLSFVDFTGDVFNMEVEEEHNYLAGFFLVCNCQNWVTSQALRDSSAIAPIRELTPEQLVGVAQRERARLVVSSYNEPLITAEWAVAVFERARAAGLDCAFVSNGNATPEVLDFFKPWIVAYKVDLKSFDDRPLSLARRHARQHHRHDPHDPRPRHLARGGDAGHPRLQRQRRASCARWPASSRRSAAISPGT